MDVKGEHQFDVSAQQLWNYLMDIDVLAKITPGISRLEKIEADKYKTVSEIKIGPVKGSFKGSLEVVDKVEPDSFVIVMEQLSKIGNAHVKVDMNIIDKGSTSSSLDFNGRAKLSGVIARTGQRVLSGVANTITKEVFASLEAHIEEDQKANPTSNGVVETQVESENIVSEKIETEKVASENNLRETAVSGAQEAIVSASDAVKETVSEQAGKIQDVVGDAVDKVKSEAIEKVAGNATESSGGFFSSIINFFKRLFG